ncbi:hypothetical protein QFZ55_001825 [Streptomyces luteogriseus]|nr:hypothetical protein [Streptomyces luteogriseus]
MLAAQPLPHLERVRALGTGPGRVQQLPVRRLQEHGIPGEVGQDAQHLGHTAAAQHGLRAPPVHLLGPLEQGVVAVDDLGVDLLRDRDERHLAVQLDERQPGRACRVDEGRGQPGEARTELHDQGRDAALGQGAHERPLLGGTSAQAVARGQQEFAALEQGGDVRHLSGVHPTHGPPEPLGARQHLGQPAAQPRQLQCPLHGDPGALGVVTAVRPAVHVPDATRAGASRTSPDGHRDDHLPDPAVDLPDYGLIDRVRAPPWT